MERPTIYNLSEAVYKDYALKQTNYEEQVAEGLVTARGDLETAASSAATVRNVTRQLPQLSILTGTYLRTEVALFVPAKEWYTMRSTSIYESPALGSIEKRKADIQKLEGMIKSIADASPQVKQAALSIKAALEQTIRDDQEILYAKGLIASILSG